MSALWHGLVDPWGDAIMQRALIEVVLLSVSGGALGCWIVLYEATYSAESLPHAMFPGLVAAALTGLPLVLGGAAGLLVAALAVALAAPPLLADAALLSLLAVAVLVAVPALGNLLVVAVLIAPAAAARLRCRRMAPMMATATVLALIGGLAGLYTSYHLHTAAGASIAVSLILGYLV